MKCKKLFTLFVVAMAAAGSMMPSKVMADEQKAGFNVKVSGLVRLHCRSMVKISQLIRVKNSPPVCQRTRVFICRRMKNMP